MEQTGHGFKPSSPPNKLSESVLGTNPPLKLIWSLLMCPSGMVLGGN